RHGADSVVGSKVRVGNSFSERGRLWCRDGACAQPQVDRWSFLVDVSLSCADISGLDCADVLLLDTDAERLSHADGPGCQSAHNYWSSGHKGAFGVCVLSGSAIAAGSLLDEALRLLEAGRKWRSIRDSSMIESGLVSAR